jgi:hypothetical protein
MMSPTLRLQDSTRHKLCNIGRAAVPSTQPTNTVFILAEYRYGTGTGTGTGIPQVAVAVTFVFREFSA